MSVSGVSAAPAATIVKPIETQSAPVKPADNNQDDSRVSPPPPPPPLPPGQGTRINLLV